MKNFHHFISSYYECFQCWNIKILLHERVKNLHPLIFSLANVQYYLGIKEYFSANEYTLYSSKTKKSNKLEIPLHNSCIKKSKNP